MELNRNLPAHEDRYLVPKDAARILGVQVQTLADWRLRGRGPAFVKSSRLVRYKLSTLVAWADAQVVQSNAEAFTRDQSR